MISLTARAGHRPHPVPLPGWRVTAGLTAAAGGAVVVTGAFLPWVETFAGLVAIPGVHGSYGRILAGAGALVALAGLWHAIRGGTWSRWLAGLGGFAALGFAGYLLIQLAATLRTLGGDSMVLASAGPGLWVAAGGALLAFATLFLPAPSSGSVRAPGSSGSPYDTSALPSPSAPAPSLPGRIEAFRALVAGRAAKAGLLARRVLSRTADLDSAGARRGLQVALGLVWLLDAALQLQPYMFGPAFVRNVLMPASMGNPAVIASPAMWAARLIGHDVAAWNTGFALIQLVIAAGLLWRPTVKAALIGSVAWSLSVWWLGEGLGGLLTGTASPVTGAPGAVILYALIAVLAWPARAGSARAGGVAASPLGGRGARLAWLVLWGGFGYLILQPAVRAPHVLSSTIAGSAAGEPGWLAAMDRATAAVIGSHGAIVSGALAALFVLIAAGILRPATTRPALVLAAITGLALWVIGENFGQLFTGMATDPNSGPLLVLLAVAYWPARRPVVEAAATPGRFRRLERPHGSVSNCAPGVTSVALARRSSLRGRLGQRFGTGT